MSLRRVCQKLIGDDATEKLVLVKKAAEWQYCRARGIVGTADFSDGRPYHLYHVSGQNVFFGYYDLQQYSKSGRELLAHIVKQGADPAADPARLVWFESGQETPHEIARTHAWCWQQGARLRWHPLKDGYILYNDVEDGRYVAKECRLDGSDVKTVARALYDVDARFGHGLSLNFARLQRLRPGYGYSVIADETCNQAVPANDGVFLVDMENGEEKLLFSLHDLAEDAPGGGQHYINHISISPSGERFTFFHLWTTDDEIPWKVRFYSADIDGSDLLLLEQQQCISHYAWLDDVHILTTDMTGRYAIYDTLTAEKNSIDSEHLTNDGHPSGLRSGFLSDTYPLKDHFQRVFRIACDGSDYHEILKVFSDPRRYGECRCDLHPRVTDNGRVIIDTTCLGDVRSMLSFELTDQELSGEKQK